MGRGLICDVDIRVSTAVAIASYSIRNEHGICVGVIDFYRCESFSGAGCAVVVACEGVMVTYILFHR